MAAEDDRTTITILHFNDVYNVEGQNAEPKGGAARFTTALRKFEGPNSLVLFSGDVFNPSMISTITQGRHLPVILNFMGIDCAVFGNHDFDFGVDNLLECVEKTNFPWLNSNVYDTETNELFANGERWLTLERCGIKFGLMGLIEPEWVATLPCIDSADVIVKDFCEEGRQLAQEMRELHGCHCIIALTHMRWPNDIKLGKEVEEIDLVLGGHDHDHGVEKVGRRHVIKSGTDFRMFHKIDLHFHRTRQELLSVDVELITVDSSWDPDPQIQELIDLNVSKLEDRMKIQLGVLDVDLDARFSKIRTEETNVGNFVCDIMLSAEDSDVALLNSGTLRSDAIIPAGPFTLRDLCNLLPMLDPLVVIEVKGQQLVEALENGVSQFPKLEGRFPQVAGVSFAFDPAKPPGQRIDLSTVEVQQAPLELDKLYKLITKHYLAQGKDGYDAFAKCPVLIDDENGPILNNLVQNHFRAIQVLNGFAGSRSRHRQSVVSIVRRRNVKHEIMSLPKIDSGTALDRWGRARKAIVDDERRYCKIQPRVEGRIRRL